MVKLIHASDVHLGITYAGIGKNHREIARELKQAAFDAFETVVNKAIEEVESADIMFIIGTSLQVYPAAGLISYAKENIPIFYIDPKPQIKSKNNLFVIEDKASSGVKKAIEQMNLLIYK